MYAANVKTATCNTLAGVHTHTHTHTPNDTLALPSKVIGNKEYKLNSIPYLLFEENNEYETVR